MAIIIPKQSHRDEAVFKEIQTKKYPVADAQVTREWLAQGNNTIDFIKQYVMADEKFIIIDIGGYFAVPLSVVSALELFKSRFLGLV